MSNIVVRSVRCIMHSSVIVYIRGSVVITYLLWYNVPTINYLLVQVSDVLIIVSAI